MVIRRLIFLFLFVFSTSIYGISSVAELYVTPRAVVPQRGVLNYGLELKYENQENFFYNFALSDNFQVGMYITEDFETLMSLHANIFNFELFSINHTIGIGEKNLGWNSSINNYNIPVLGEYAIYTFRLTELNSFYHFGFSEYKTTQDYYFNAGAEYHFKRFKTMVEWDGKQSHFSILYHLRNNYDFFLAITPSPYTGFGSTKDNYLSIAFIKNDLFFTQRNEINDLKKKYTDLNNKFEVANAKMDVFKEFSSVDFLEEFQQFLLQEHMVEKELEQSKKSAIRSALDHMQRGLEFYYNGQYQLALEEYNIVVNLVPTFSMGYARLGSIHYKLNNLEQARLNWTQALDLDPSNESLKIFLKRVTPLDEIELKLQEDIIEPSNLLDIVPSEDSI